MKSMTMFINNMSSEEIASKLTYSQRDSLYRLLWAEHVREDVMSHIEERGDDIPEKDKEDLIETVANLYVYKSAYDCNLSYWENINNLIEASIKK